MNNLLKLNTETDPNGNVDFIANKTKKNYVNLGGINDKDVVDCVHAFLCSQDVWSETDTVVLTTKALNYTPREYHNISFILKFYNKARIAKDLQHKQAKAQSVVQPTQEHVIPEPITVSVPSNANCNIEPAVPIIVKPLTNPNIKHDTKPKPVEKKDQPIKIVEKNSIKKRAELEQMIEEDSEHLDESYNILDTENEAIAKKSIAKKKDYESDESDDSDQSQSDDSDQSQSNSDQSSDQMSEYNNRSKNDSDESDSSDLEINNIDFSDNLDKLSKLKSTVKSKPKPKSKSNSKSKSKSTSDSDSESEISVDLSDDNSSVATDSGDGTDLSLEQSDDDSDSESEVELVKSKASKKSVTKSKPAKPAVKSTTKSVVAQPVVKSTLKPKQAVKVEPKKNTPKKQVVRAGTGDDSQSKAKKSTGKKGK